MTDTRPECCPTCDADPKAASGRYCAQASCRCGHPDCPAFASWTPLRELNVTPLPTPAGRNAWADREDSTWIDQI